MQTFDLIVIGAGSGLNISSAAAENGFLGIEATNTTTNSVIKESCGITEEGGVSGQPLSDLATDCVRQLAPLAQRARIDLIGVGGIMSGKDAVQKQEAGARAVQLYTGLIFKGPALIRECLEMWVKGNQ